MSISIHALVKRATLDNVLLVVDLSDFNPRPREEGDKIYAPSDDYPYDFNPRPREEGDHQLCAE